MLRAFSGFVSRGFGARHGRLGPAFSHAIIASAMTLAGSIGAGCVGLALALGGCVTDKNDVTGSIASPRQVRSRRATCAPLRRPGATATGPTRATRLRPSTMPAPCGPDAIPAGRRGARECRHQVALRHRDPGAPTARRWPMPAASRKPPRCCPARTRRDNPNWSDPVGAGLGRRPAGRPCPGPGLLHDGAQDQAGRPRRPDQPRPLLRACRTSCRSPRHTIRQARSAPGADMRVRQNLALVLALEGKFGEAEQVAQRRPVARPTRPRTSPRSAP